jgi:arginine-tRNA-protein transferase
MESSAAAAAAAAVSTRPSIQHVLHRYRRENVVGLCGVSWVSCGYCKGARAHLSKAPSEIINTTTEDDVTVMNTNSITDNESNPTTTTTTTTTATIASSKAYSVLMEKNWTPDLYEQFIANGWRRSGTSMYKPSNSESCCPAITIRLPVQDFVPSKSQTKILKKFQSLLRRGGANETTIHVPMKDNGIMKIVPNNHAKKTKTNHPHTSHMEKTKPIIASSQRVSLPKETRITEQLVHATKVALQEILTTYSATTTSEHVGVQIPSNVIPPIQYKLYGKKKNKKKKHPITDSSGTDPSAPTIHSDAATFTTVSTSICATLAGHDWKYRTQLAMLLTEKLRQSQYTPIPTTTTATNTCTSNQYFYFNAECHPESGHVLIHLPTHPELLDHHPTVHIAAHVDNGNAHDHCKLRVQPRKETNKHVAEAPSDKIAGWLKQQQQSNADDRVGNSSITTSPNNTDDEATRGCPILPHQWKVTTMCATESALDPRVHKLYWEYQHVVHNDPDPRSTALATTGTDTQTDENDKNEDDHPWNQQTEFWIRAKAMLEREYPHLSRSAQRTINKAYASFCEFLVEHPFEETTFHQHYFIDDVLVAVGVIDVLTNGVSSVYLFYSPSFAEAIIPLGKFAILQEIEYTRSIGKQFYYLGYYIESCTKMRYKTDYKPSELLCPVTYRWVDAEIAKAILIRDSPEHHFCRLYEPRHQAGEKTDLTDCQVDDDGNREHHQSIREEDILLDVGLNQLVRVNMLPPEGESLVRPFLSEYLEYAGKLASRTIVSFR